MGGNIPIINMILILCRLSIRASFLRSPKLSHADVGSVRAALLYSEHELGLYCAFLKTFPAGKEGATFPATQNFGLMRCDTVML